MGNTNSKELLYDAGELIKISDTLDAVIKQLATSCNTNFSTMKDTSFYMAGRATEEIERIVSIESRGVDFTNIIAKDYYGKLQMLLIYYSQLSEYCMVVMKEVQEKDETIAKYLQELSRNSGGGK